MNKLLFILGITLTLVWNGCERDLDTWSGKDVVYLEQTVDSTVVSFVYIDSKNEYDTVVLQANVMGEVVNSETRYVSVKVTGKNAEAGVDYLPLKERYEIAPGKIFCEIPVCLKRTDALKSEIKEITVELQPNEDFDLLYQEDIPSTGGTVVFSKLSRRILFHEMMLEAPDTWNEYYLGTFSAAKFREICDQMDIPREKFLDRSYMSFGRIQNIKRYMDIYFDRMKALGMPVLEENGSEMTMGEGVL